MVECKRLIVPVFIDVEPRHVRHQTGPFAPAFKRHRKNKKMGKEEVSQWSDALRKAGELSGYTLADTEGNEAKLVRLIVKRILDEVNKTSLHVANHPVGLDSHIADVEKMLDVDDNKVRMVGIHGMGGIGKTTLAKAVYNKIYARFDASSFISDIREAAKQSTGLVSLQKKLLGDFFKDENVNVGSIDQGIEILKTRIRSKKVLLVLDDVDHESQLNALAGGLDWFCSGSRIIVTTRDKHALKAKTVNLYKPKELNGTQALQLFSWHAFGKKDPDPKFAELSREVASAGAGLPLALTIFGSHFFDMETVQEWKEELQKLQEDPNEDIHVSLKISFDALGEKEKKVFLDIACFFLQEYDIELPLLMWEGCKFFPNRAIKVLRHKSLININDHTGKFEMHDLIRDMGRKIAQDSRSRLWKDEEILDVLETKKGKEKIEAIQLNAGTFEKPMYVEADSFVAMSELRMLRLGTNVRLDGKFEHFPKKLRWLKWRITLDSLPDGLHLENIVVLDLSYSSITQLWNPQVLKSTKVFGKMKVLNLTYCTDLTICPDFTSMPHLQNLNFSHCKKMSELHPSIGLLKSLIRLDLSECLLLKGLPQEIWQLTSLEKLYLTYCKEITTLPSQIEDPKTLKQVLLGKLKVLYFSYCSNLTICPDFTSMPHLQSVNFSGCKKMSELHPSIGLLKSLTHLYLSCCSSLKRLPQEIWQLTSLEELDLSYCSEITTLPSQMEDPKTLKQVLLGKLKVLNFVRCSNLNMCPDFTSMPHLEKLNIHGCEKMSELHPSIGLLKRLTRLSLEGCTSLLRVPQEIWQLTSLEELDLCFRSEITAFPSQMEDPKSLNQVLLGKLKVLDFSYCSNLTICPDFTSMSHLEKLNFRGCYKMSELHPSIGLLKSLIHLNLASCTSLKRLPQEIWQLTSLEELRLLSCRGITALPSQMEDPKSLKQVLFGKLKFLDFILRSNLTIHLDFTSMPHLQKLNLGFCLNMTELHPSIGHLKSLTHLSLRQCISLERLPQEIWRLSSLEELDLEGCHRITNFPSPMEDPESLEPVLLGKLRVLNFERCSNLIVCPDFTSMPHLERLNFVFCEKMSELHPSIGLLKSLTELDLGYCLLIKFMGQKIWTLVKLDRPVGEEEDGVIYSGTEIATLPSHLGNFKSFASLCFRGTNH